MIWAMLGKALSSVMGSVMGSVTGGVLGGLFGKKGESSAGGLGAELVRAGERALSGRASQNEAQGRINASEIEGAPPSNLRLWRSFLGWTLSLLFAWEVAGRLVFIPLFLPELEKDLPPSALDQILALLMGMLGLGF